MLQIELFGYTRIRAHDLERTESTSWVLKSQANMNMPLGTASEKQCREWKLPSRLWQDCPVPNTVCPTFETCNISRRYELEVRVGLAHAMADGMRPEVMVLPLRLPVQVYSGIAPPPQLLRAMANNPRPQAATTPPPLFPRPSANGTSVAAPLQPDTPLATPPTPFQDNGFFPAQTGSYSVQQEPDIPDEAPPSYEDAIADEIAPVDGPRRDYHVPSQPESEHTALDPDTKRSGLGRRVSERLFPTNGPAPSQNRSVSTPNTLQTTPMPEDDDAGPASSPTVEPDTRRLQKRRTSSARDD
ncbi:hypothetical protein HRR87_002123 [Exophiala dermatitidis]|nr:hypothetical protein HRR87_002123 [Exophiala dermatitidis]